MGKLKNFFKHKFVIVTLCILLIGGAILGTLEILPKSTSYTSNFSGGFMGRDYKTVVSFKGDKVITKYKFEDGEVQEVAQQDYEIKEGVLYVGGSRWGEIDAYKIHISSSMFIFNGKSAEIAYVSQTAKIAKYISFGLLGLGSLMFVLAVYVGVSKKKKKA